MLADGQKAQDAKQFDAAVQLYREASKLAPGNVEVLTAVSKAEQARDQFAAVKQTTDAAAAKKREEEQRRESAAIRRRRQQGHRDEGFQRRESSAGRGGQIGSERSDRHQGAARPGVGEESRTDTDTANKQKKADYEHAMTAAQTALKAKSYQEAINSYNVALRVMPGDPVATAQLKDADKQLKEQLATQEAETKRKLEEAKKVEAFTSHINQGKVAMAAKRYDEAVKDYADALKLFPGDAAATKAQKEAQQALDAAKTPVPPPLPPPPPLSVNSPAEYKKQMDSGAALEKQKKFTEALAAYREALKHMAGDAKATAAVKWAEFEVHMTDGQRLFDAKKFPDAVKEFEEAVKLFPDNADAKNLLKRAKDGK